jgi:hypothetical protein
MALFKVGIMSNTAMVEAPSALSAAVFYGLNTGGNAQFMAVVYEQDGKPYEGKPKAPAAVWQFGDAQPTPAELQQLEDELPRCRFVEETIHG